MAPGDTVDEPGAAAMGCRRGRRPVRLLRALGGDLLACAGIAVALTVILVAFSNQESSLEYWLWAFAFNMIVATAIGLLLSNLYRFAQPWFLKRFPGRVGYWTSHALIVTCGVGVGVELALRITTALGGPNVQVLRSDVLQVAVVVTVVVTAAAVGFETLRERARRVELTAQRAQQEALRAQLEALQARTNPHFLFNSLNTVAGLIEEDPRKAEDVLERLSGLFRYSLEGSRTDWVGLEQEIDAVSGYLEVERVRLGDRLRSEVHVEPETQGILVPPLLLQPLVENAVLHAVAPRSEGGCITVTARRNGAALCLEVTDNGPGLGSSRHRGSGTSLEDLHRRLEMIYGGRARLDVSSPDDAGCRVTLTLPLGPPGDGLVKEAT
jgi:two-component system sensor histidine kinase AlgZ